MKKIIIIFLAFGASIVANADYLYWQVTDSSVSSTQGGTISGYTVASLWAVKNGVYTQLESSYISGFGPDGFETTSATYVSVPSANEYSVDLSSLGDLTGYSFFVELKTAADGTQLGYSNFITGDEVETYVASGSLSEIPSVTVWHGDTYSAPEPTSGLLMLLGAACLGLRRKARSAA